MVRCKYRDNVGSKKLERLRPNVTRSQRCWPKSPGSVPQIACANQTWGVCRRGGAKSLGGSFPQLVGLGARGLGGMGPQNAIHLWKGYPSGYALVCDTSICRFNPWHGWLAGLACLVCLAWLACSPGWHARLTGWLSSPGAAAWPGCKTLHLPTFCAKH